MGRTQVKVELSDTLRPRFVELLLLCCVGRCRPWPVRGEDAANRVVAVLESLLGGKGVSGGRRGRGGKSAYVDVSHRRLLPPVGDDDEAEIVAVCEVKEVVGFGFRPVLGCCKRESAWRREG